MCKVMYIIIHISNASDGKYNYDMLETKYMPI